MNSVKEIEAKKFAKEEEETLIIDENVHTEELLSPSQQHNISLVSYSSSQHGQQILSFSDESEVASESLEPNSAKAKDGTQQNILDVFTDNQNCFCFADCMEYHDEIMKNMRESELQHRPSHLTAHQQDIKSWMRALLVDWVVEVCASWRFRNETLFLAVNYIDKTLCRMTVFRNELQLVGAVCMYIACKYVQYRCHVQTPGARDFAEITDHTFSQKQVVEMENLVLKAIDYRLNTPTAYFFLMNYLRVLKLDSTSQISNQSVQV